MLQWIDNYYVGEGVRDPRAIQKKIEQQKLTAGVYLLTFSRQKDTLMELLPARMLKQKILYERCPVIIGMAGNKEDAIELCTRILMECYRANGNYCLKEYLKNR